MVVVVVVVVAVVVGQLAQRSLPIPEIRGSNALIDKNLHAPVEKTKINIKRPGMAHLSKQ